MVSLVAVQMSQPQTSSLTKRHNVNFVAVPISNTQTYILTYNHHDTESMTDVTVTNISFKVCASHLSRMSLYITQSEYNYELL
jgi:hypothetical protein